MIRLGVLIAALQVASPVTDLLVDDIGRPCARVLVRIELPSFRDLDEPDVEVAAIDLEQDLPHSVRIERCSLAATGSVLETVMEVPVNGRVGLAAYSSVRGYAEAVIVAGTWAQGSRAPGASVDRPEVRLKLPAISQASTVRVLPEDRVTGRKYATCSYTIELPATRLEIGHESRRLREIDGETPLEFRVPAGRYRVEGSCRFQMCGSGSPLPDLATGLQETVVCRERMVVEVPHLLEDGVSLRLQVNVEGAPDHAKPFLSLMPGQFRNVEWSDPCHDPLDQWYATATLEPILEGVARGTAVAREIRWGTYRQSVADSHQRVPLGMSAFTTSVYRPGRYRMRLSGPLIEPATAEIVIEPADLTGDGLIACGRTRLTVRAKR